MATIALSLTQLLLPAAAIIVLAHALLLDLSQHCQWVSVDRRVKGIHELFGSDSDLGKDTFYILFDGLATCIDSCDYLVDGDRLVDVEVLV